MIRIQMAHEPDSISDDGSHVGYRLPYPFYADENGMVQQQGFWRGKVYKVIGFQKSPTVQRIDLWWDEAWKSPRKAVGMYLVTSDDDGNWGTFPTAVMEMEETS